RAHASTLSAGSASYGYQIAPAAAEVVCRPTSSAKIDTRYPRSANTTPQVSPDTPAPTIAIDCFIASAPENQNPNFVRSNPDWRMIERVVPIGISFRRSGTITMRPSADRNLI